MDIGKHLREAREFRGMTLHQVAGSTRLPATTLQCIERNEFNRLPGGIFARAHLRAYAAEVGVESDEVVFQFLFQFPVATEELPIVRAVPAVEHTHAGRDLLLTVAGIVVALVAYGLIHNSVELSDSPPVKLGEPPPSIESVVTQRSGLGRLTATERDEPGLAVEIQPAGACWLSAMADGRVVIYRLLQSGERVTIGVRNELVLRVGAPAVFAYKLNGVSGRSLGEAGQPVTVTITGKNYQTFLAGSAPETRRVMSRMLPHASRTPWTVDALDVPIAVVNGTDYVLT
jgi:cytoskeleton protein RodZ